MLSVEPVGVQVGVEGEVSLITELPDDVARAASILIVDLQDPGLMTQREQQIPVIGRIYERVGMGPVREEQGMTVYIQMVERVPNPDGVVVRIEIDDRVSRYRWLSRIPREVPENTRIADSDQKVTIGEQHEIVVDGKTCMSYAALASFWLKLL